MISYSNVKYDRGCAIPEGKYSKNINKKLSIQNLLEGSVEDSVEDTLDSGGNSICWYQWSRVKESTDSCFCNTDLCNEGGRHLASYSMIIIYILLVLLKYYV